MRTRALASLGLFSSTFLVSLYCGCGTRTGLLLPDDEGPTPVVDAGIDHRTPSPRDSSVPDDALPPIDAAPRDGGFITNCPDAGATLVYVLTQGADLYSFYPPDLSFTRIGHLSCATGGDSAFSMAVDRKGIAYAVFSSGTLYRVSTANASCTPTTFIPHQQGFDTFGMGFAADTNDPGETLYIAQNAGTGGTSQGLAMIDTTTFGLKYIGPFAPPITPPELTGTGDGRLFGWTPDRVSGSHLYEIDKASGKILGRNNLAVGSANEAFAFAYWGGVFWIFTAPGGPSTVTRFDLATGSEKDVATFEETIVGAGVSTCAPSQ
jgi:hypothetical protein